MTVRVQRIGNQLGILLSEQELNELCLRENDVLEIEAIDGRIELKPSANPGRHLESYRRTRDEHAGVYTELAK
jgi:antitoxin component of MazEF toxin-antitoxin module